MDIRLVFGRNLRRYRLAAGLSQEAVAERMGVDRAHVSSMERGQQNVTPLTVREAAQALGRKSMFWTRMLRPRPRHPAAPQKRRGVDGQNRKTARAEILIGGFRNLGSRRREAG